MKSTDYVNTNKQGSQIADVKFIKDVIKELHFLQEQVNLINTFIDKEINKYQPEQYNKETNEVDPIFFDEEPDKTVLSECIKCTNALDIAYNEHFRRGCEIQMNSSSTTSEQYQYTDKPIADTIASFPKTSYAKEPQINNISDKYDEEGGEKSWSERDAILELRNIANYLLGNTNREGHTKSSMAKTLQNISDYLQNLALNPVKDKDMANQASFAADAIQHINSPLVSNAYCMLKTLAAYLNTRQLL